MGFWQNTLGKRFFQKKTNFPNEDSPVEHLEISLFGLKSTQEISEAIFRSLHPVLGSAPVRFAGDILKGILKANIQLDLTATPADDDGQAGTETDTTVDIGASLEKMKIPNFLNNPKGHVLVFDDFERCMIPVEELLGYLYSLVEFSDQKIIVLANVKKIDTDEQNKKSVFSQFNDKLFGKTLTVQPDFKSAKKKFAKDSTLEITGQNLPNYEAKIEEIFLNSKTKNLRLLQRILWDWESFHNRLNDKVRENSGLMNDLLANFLTLHFEHQKVSLADGNLHNYAQLFGLSDDEKDRFREYSTFSTFQLILSADIWEKILSGQYVDPKVINKELLAVRRHIICPRFRSGLRETLLIVLVDIMQRLCGIASVDVR